MDFETRVKLQIYQTVAQTTKLPSATFVAAALNAELDDVRSAFISLNQKRLLVPEPGDPDHIRMASPFSGIPTDFPVHIHNKIYYANCSWDSLAVPAALHEDGVIRAKDAFSGESIVIEVKQGKPVECECVFHFAVPAALWWNDIIYT